MSPVSIEIMLHNIFPFKSACAFLSSKDNWRKCTVLVHFRTIIESKVAVKPGLRCSLDRTLVFKG